MALRLENAMKYAARPEVLAHARLRYKVSSVGYTKY
jgi:hypothetical protein